MSLKPPTGSNAPRSDGAPVDLADYDVEGGTVDATSSINAAAALALARGVPLVGSGTYKVTGTVTFGNIDVDLSGATFRADLPYPLGSETAVVKVSQAGAQYLNRVKQRTVKLPRVQNADRGTASVVNWVTGGGTTSTSQNDIGVQLVNCEGCTIDVPQVLDFSVGLDTAGESAAGFVYNTVRIGHLTHNRINHRLGQLDSTGWCNQNVFVGGSYGFYDSQIAARLTGVRQVLLSRIDSGTYQVNGNVWVGASFENVAPEYEVECYGRENIWFGCRWERTGDDPRVFFRNGTGVTGSENLIEGGYGVRNITMSLDSASAARNLIKHPQGVRRSGFGDLTLDGDFSILMEDGPLAIKRASSGTVVAQAYVSGETNPRLLIYNNGIIDYASADAAADIRTSVQGTGIFQVQGIGNAVRTMIRAKGHASQGATNPFFEGQTSAGQIRWQAMHDGSMVARAVANGSDPAAPAANYGEHYFRLNGSGKMEFCVRFPTGAIQILATEP